MLPSIKRINSYVDSVFAGFGTNKTREIARLLYEIAKRDHIPFHSVISNPHGKDFYACKEELLKRRYPSAYSLAGGKSCFYLPKLDVDPSLKVRFSNSSSFRPKHIFVERSVRNSPLARRFKELFPYASFSEIESVKKFLQCELPGNSIRSYNKRGENIFITRENYDFIKPCPCTHGAVSCGYNVLNIGFGCTHECSYCFLQEYQNVPGIIFPANPEDFLKHANLLKPARGMFPYVRLGSGEFTDSLLFDSYTGYSKIISEALKHHPEIVFEFKTKSVAIENIVNRPPGKNIIVSWSLNPQNIIRENEWLTPSLRERISAAAACVRHGHKVAFHMDPIMYYQGWRKDYREIINYVFDRIDSRAIQWISLGTLRFSRVLKKIMENRFPENKILDEEMILGFDGKMRYPDSLRITMYSGILSDIRERSKKTFVYLCMEARAVHASVFSR
ncbi:MAG: hypothetical protein PHE58_01385 [Candidatus Omnitrophica bacterium]|nr:hypothetical protein [Candidatus Omnitrophota bacterium]